MRVQKGLRGPRGHPRGDGQPGRQVQAGGAACPEAESADRAFGTLQVGQWPWGVGWSGEGPPSSCWHQESVWGGGCPTRLGSFTEPSSSQAVAWLPSLLCQPAQLPVRLSQGPRPSKVAGLRVPLRQGLTGPQNALCFTCLSPFPFVSKTGLGDPRVL